ncbi:MAG TPA: hypothetical protein VFI14_00630 [Chryseosolibacter sp.]|nr:hypothetical protein [Chryseosolibacter sp.]
MDKLALKKTLIKAHEETLEELKTDYASNRSGENLSLEDVQDADDHSHQKQNEEYLKAIEKQIQQREKEIERLHSLDFGSKTFVTEGAVALVNGQYFIIGIPACQFDLEGKHYVAMSPDAPFYQALMDKRQKDSFVFNNKTYTVESVF